ncbi:hypothetical protein AB0K67_13700 [Nonomuraea sp. NPDC052634]|uniref:DUF6891 domain-containing protein n=1 Tax=Nonomuraea sp. NPDC052634 TaxID=3155813 RepID=UPI00343CDE27
MVDETQKSDARELVRLLLALGADDFDGIVARTDFTCCQSCAIAELGGEVPEDERHAYRGYVFCHRQDMRDAVDGGRLSLAYGVFNDAAVTADQAGIGEEVTETIRRHEDDPVPVSLPQARSLLLDLTPRAGNSAVFIGRSGGVVQMRWENGRRLRLETPDEKARHSRGRHVTPDEADDMVTILAREDRGAVDRLGNLETHPWDG